MARLLNSRDLNLIFTITLFGSMGFPVVTPMLPTIRDALEISNTLVGWVMTAYGLPALIFIPLAGFLGDRYGKKKIIVPSLILFGLAGGATMFATSFEALLVLRFLQGIGAGALTTLNIALIGDRYSGRERATVMGYMGSLNNLTSGIFPLIGGVPGADRLVCPVLDILARYSGGSVGPIRFG